MESDWLTTVEAANELRVTTAAIRQAILRGNIEAVKRGRDNFIRRAELERYRREHLGQKGRPKQEK